MEDGARLSSLQSYQAGQTPLESLLDEFKQIIEQLELTKSNDEVLTALEKLWNDASERFSAGGQRMEIFQKKARLDATTWLNQRLRLTPA